MFREMRRKKQALSEEECVELLVSQKRAALAVAGDEGWPYALPIDFYYDPGDGCIYFHCAREGHKIDAMTANPKVCLTLWNEGEKSEDWSYFVKSVIVFGKAQPLDDEKLIIEKARAFGMKYYPSAAEVDAEIAKDIHRALIYKIVPEHITGKRVHEK